MVIDDDRQVDPSDVTQSSGDWPYKAGVFPNYGWKPKEGSTQFSVYCLFWRHQVWGPIIAQNSESEGSTWSSLDCFDLRPRHKIIYIWKPGGLFFWFSTLIWKNTTLIWPISARLSDVRGSSPAYHHLVVYSMYFE